MIVLLAAAIVIASLNPAPGPLAQAPDYAALYEQGVPYGTFLEGAKGRRAAWLTNSEAATAPPALADRARALSHSWRILAVAEDRCSDSVSSLPWVAKLAAAAPDRLSLRVVNSATGRAVMDAHRTPDGRSATPTLALIRDDGEIRVWVERPDALVAWIAAQKAADPKFDVNKNKMKWYADDAGRSTLDDLIRLLEQR